MRTSCVMMASSVTLLIEEEEMKVEGVVEVGRAAASVYVHLGRSCASLHLTVATLMAPLMEK